MVNKLYIIFFLNLYLVGCYYDPTTSYRSNNLTTQFLPATTIYQWTSDINFRPHDSHQWGFDRHTEPENDEDKVVHFSIASSENGFVNIHRNYDIDAGYTYYICNSGDITQNVYVIDDSHSENEYEKDFEYQVPSSFENSINQIGLCREYGGNQQLVKLLDIHTYGRKDFNVTVLQVGYDDFVEKTKYLNQWKNFWTADFARVLNQAVVNVRYQFKTIKLSDNVSKEESDEYYADVDGSFLSVKVDDTNSSCYQETMDDIDVLKEKLVNIFSGNEMSDYDKRVIMGFGIPTRKFWTFRENFGGGIEPCTEGISTNDQPQPNTVYDLGMIYSTDDDCAVYADYKLKWHYGADWDVSDDGGRSWRSIKNLSSVEDIIDPRCNVLLEEKHQLTFSKGTSNQYFKAHISSTSRAETKYLTLNGMGNYIGAVSLNPYTEENYRFVLHELGHLLGLEDVEDLSNLGLKNKESSEGNLMFKFDQNGVKLRNRPMLSKDGTHYEKQWDCLHRLSESDCADSRQWEIDQ